MALVVKNLPASAGDIRDVGSIPGLGRSPGEGNGNPLQYSCQDNRVDRGAWWATVHMVSKSQTWLKGLSALTLNNNSVLKSSHVWSVASIFTQKLTYIISSPYLNGHFGMPPLNASLQENLWMRCKKHKRHQLWSQVYMMRETCTGSFCGTWWGQSYRSGGNEKWFWFSLCLNQLCDHSWASASLWLKLVELKYCRVSFHSKTTLI